MNRAGQPRDGCRVTSAASCARDETPSFMKMWATWVWTVRLDMYRRSPICGLDGPAEPPHGPARVFGGHGELERPPAVRGRPGAL